MPVIEYFIHEHGIRDAEHRYGCFNRHAALGITVDRNRCTACGHCAAICPMDIKIAGDQECISCGKCQHSCPSAAISFRQIHKNRKDEQPCQK